MTIIDGWESARMTPVYAFKAVLWASKSPVRGTKFA